jgi:hypothetical protein
MCSNLVKKEICKHFFLFVQTGSQLGRSMFTMSGNQGNSWQSAKVTIPSSTGSQGYNVSFDNRYTKEENGGNIW